MIYDWLNNIVRWSPTASHLATAESGTKVVTAAGEYRWIAEFIRDANNASTGKSAGDEPTSRSPSKPARAS